MSNLNNKLVALVGMCGSGKSEVADQFIKAGYGYVRFGQITLDEVKKRGLDVNEANEKMIREGFRKEHGPAAYAILNIPKFDEALEKGNVIGDGLYSWSEYRVLKEKYGDNLIVVAVYAPPSLRYERLAGRVLTKEDVNMKNRALTPEQAKARDYAEIENIEKGGPIAMADYLIVNITTLGDLHFQTESIIKQINNL